MLLLQHFTKSCSKCKEIKTFSEFSNCKKRKDSKYPYCKTCRASASLAYYNSNKELYAKNKRKYRQENKYVLAEKQREYRAANKDILAKRDAEYYISNKEEIHRKSALYREKNRQKIRDRINQYYQKNKELLNKKKQVYFKTEKGRATLKNTHLKRRAHKRNGDVVTQQLMELQKNAKFCYWCNISLKKVKVHIDHYIPLSKGGEHTISNLVVSCPRCNLTKNAKDPFIFAQSLGKLL